MENLYSLPELQLETFLEVVAWHSGNDEKQNIEQSPAWIIPRTMWRKFLQNVT